MRWRVGSEFRDENGMYGWFMVPVPEESPRLRDLLRLAEAEEKKEQRRKVGFEHLSGYQDQKKDSK